MALQLALTAGYNSQSYSVSTLAGSSSAGSQNGQGTASFFAPFGAAIDSAGNIYVADVWNHRIRKITSTGLVSTFAGSGFSGSQDGQATLATFNSPHGVAVDPTGIVYVADTSNNKIRIISTAGVVSTFAGNGTQGSQNGQGSSATFWGPYGVALDSAGNVYVVDTGNHLIRKITPTGVVSTFAGSGSAGSQNGQGTVATFNFPRGIATDSAGNVYVADWFNHNIRKITPTGLVSTLAGSGSAGSQNGQGSAASFDGPRGVTVDSSGNVYVADTGNRQIRKISASGLVSTLAGSGATGSQNGLSTSASFEGPSGVVVDSTGNIYVVDVLNIRKISLVSVASVTSSAASAASSASVASVRSSTASPATATSTSPIVESSTPKPKPNGDSLSMDSQFFGRLTIVIYMLVPIWAFL